jgi:hypothetical protein
MSHGHDDHGHAQETFPADKTPKVASSSSLWVAIILIGLFIAAVNFISVSGTPEEGGHGGGHTKEGAVMPTREATSNKTLSGETGVGRPEADTTQYHGSTAPAEEAHSEGH